MRPRSLEFWRGLCLALVVLAVVLAVVAGRLLFRLRAEERAVARAALEEPLPDRLELRAAHFGELPGWESDRLAEAVPALASSCRVLRELPGSRSIGGPSLALKVGDWQRLCERIASMSGRNDQELRRLLEAELAPWAVTNRGDPTVLFTGYYEPTLTGSLRPDERFQFPLYIRPPELVGVDLGDFREDLRGRRVAGRVEGGSLVPYLDRAAIGSGGLAGRGLELVWVDSPIDAFFLHIQGSGRVELQDGGVLRVGYSSQNGHPYSAIGRVLVERGEMSLEEVSMQSIRSWLKENPDQAEDLMQTNASYVFFRKLAEPGPVGSQGVVLTPGRSAAVDKQFLPLGVPIWVDSKVPPPVVGAPDRVLQRLVVAQDTGGAIRGPTRGDLFWGPGREAAEIAGRMRHEGRMWLLLPRFRSDHQVGNAGPSQEATR